MRAAKEVLIIIMFTVVIWLTYCRYDIKPKTVNKSIKHEKSRFESLSGTTYILVTSVSLPLP